jgi:UDP-N-acetylglucosamine--N-acetylmuramyl-(pentapeptide) pyrophosphoryl-undecaprenol N-acetylglucosamine transferase
MVAAARRGIPTALHESNATPGVAVKRLQKRVDRIWINFSLTKEKLTTDRPILCVGNPTLGEFGSLSKTEARRRLGVAEDAKLLLSFGGSLGAEEINKTVLSLMEDPAYASLNILHVHASGKREYPKMEARYARLSDEQKKTCILKDYIYDMPLWMAAADVVISRAGAMTLSELALMKKPSILIPSPNVADNHQYYNALALADAGAAILIEEKDLTKERLHTALAQLFGDADAARRMGACAASFADPDANRRIWQEIQSMLRKDT